MQLTNLLTWFRDCERVILIFALKIFFCSLNHTLLMVFNVALNHWWKLPDKNKNIQGICVKHFFFHERFKSCFLLEIMYLKLLQYSNLYVTRNVIILLRKIIYLKTLHYYNSYVTSNENYYPVSLNEEYFMKNFVYNFWTFRYKIMDYFVVVVVVTSLIGI